MDETAFLILDSPQKPFSISSINVSEPDMVLDHQTASTNGLFGCQNGDLVAGELSCNEEMEKEAAAVTVMKSVSHRVAKIRDEAFIERRISPRLQSRSGKGRHVYATQETTNPAKKCSQKRAKLDHQQESEERSVSLKSEAAMDSSSLPGNNADPSLNEFQGRARVITGDSSNVTGMSAAFRVKDTLRIFNAHFLHFVQDFCTGRGLCYIAVHAVYFERLLDLFLVPMEEEKRCKKVEADAIEVANTLKAKGKKLKGGIKSKINLKVKVFPKTKKEAVRGEDMKRSSKRPDLKAISKMMETRAILYSEKRFGHLPGIDVGHQFFSRAEMVAVGFHNHWLNGIDFMGGSYSKLEEYRGYTFPLAVSIVLSGQYEDDLDNSEDVVYTGQGGHDLLGNKRQICDQVMKRGNLALKNNMECSVPVRVIRGHESANSYCGKVYTYDGLYKVVHYWAQKGVSGFTVFKYRLRRLEGQPILTTNQVHFTRAQAPRCLSELRGLVCKDISGGQENIPIPASNVVDDPPVPPSGYEYCKSIKVAKSVKFPVDAAGCDCKGNCIDPRTCACARLNGSDFPYVRRDGGRLVEAKDVVFECGPNCGCGPGCINRTSQHGLKYRLEVFRTPNKGWAVRSWDSIPSGAPLCEYTGILMRTDDIDTLSENNFIFEIDCLQTMRGIDGRERRLGDVSIHSITQLDKIDDKKLESTPEFCIDAGSTGNIARFINHSCEPNLFVQCVLSSHRDIKLARIMLFAADNIPPLQELTYDYGYALDSVMGPDGEIKKMPCYCGAPDCRKRLY